MPFLGIVVVCDGDADGDHTFDFSQTWRKKEGQEVRRGDRYAAVVYFSAFAQAFGPSASASLELSLGQMMVQWK